MSAPRKRKRVSQVITAKIKPSPVDPEYKKGAPRNHHRFDIPDGDTILQVNNALFKVHRHFLVKHSSIMSDTLNLPLSVVTGISGDSLVNGRYIPLTGDTVAGWECLLGLFYPDDPCQRPSYTAEQWASVVILANKYVMEGIEASSIEQLRSARPALDKVDFMVVAQNIGSDELYKEALRCLAKQDAILSLESAQKIGLVAFHELVVAKQDYFSYRRRTALTPAQINALMSYADDDE